MTIAEFTDTPDTNGQPWDVVPDADGEPPTLALTDRAGADRHLRAIARLENEYDLEKAGALAEVERIQQWIAQRYETLTAQTDWHRSVLHRYHEAVLAVDPRLKTIKLPHGELQARAQQPSWEIDPTTALPWLQANLPSVVRPPKPGEPSIDVAALKRSVTVAGVDEGWDEMRAVVLGEPVPGVTVTARPAKFSTVIAEPEPAHDQALLCDFCQTPGDAVHGEVRNGRGPNGIGRAHQGCEVDHEYGKYEDWRDSQPEPLADGGPF